MIYPAPDKLDSSGSKYALVIVAAKRARQVKEGARRLTDSRSANPLTVALEEMAADEIIALQVGEPEKLPESLPATPVLGGLVSSGLSEGATKVTKADIYAKLTGGEMDDFVGEASDEDEDVVGLDEDDEEEEIEDEADVLTLVDPDGEYEQSPAVAGDAEPDAAIFKEATDEEV